MPEGEVFKRCGCVDIPTGKRFDRRCPRISDPGHGSWYFSCTVQDAFGRRRRVRRGGHLSRAAALEAQVLFLTAVQSHAAVTWTVKRWLRTWLSERLGIRPTTRLCHEAYIEKFLVPYLGDIRLSELSQRHIAAMFAEIGQRTNRCGDPHTPSTLAHIRTTLRAALNAAVRQGLLRESPARHVELPPHRRARPVFWTDSRVAAWQATGVRPRIAVWTPAQLTQFLDFTRKDRLHALWWLVALRGLRRGEAAALRWSDIDLDNAELTISRARTSAGYQVFEDAPKTDAGVRTIALDKHTVKALRAHRFRQQQEFERAGLDWCAAGYVFTCRRCQPVHPQHLTRRFSLLVAASGLPPVRLHDLRHGAACLAHAAGADLKTIQQQLGHASIAITADIYTTVLPTTQRQAAKATARLLKHCSPKATRKSRHKRRAQPGRPDA